MQEDKSVECQPRNMAPEDVAINTPEGNTTEKNSALLHILVNQSNDAIFLADPDTGYLLYVNDKACNDLGYTREELLHMGVLDIEDRLADLSAWNQHVNEIREKGSVFFRGVHKRKDGTTFPVEVNIKFVALPRKNYIVAVARDISSRKQAEDALKESERQLSEAQRVARLGSWEWNIRTNKVIWSEEVYRLFGIRPDEFGASYEAFLKFVHPEDREMLDSAVKKAVAEKEPYDIDARIVRPDGSRWIMYARGEVIYDDADNPILMRGVLQDITDRKQAEEALKKSEKMLQTIIEAEPECVKLLDKDCNLIMMNRAGLSMLQVDSLDQVRGQCVCPMIASEYKTAFMELTARVFRGESGILLFEMTGVKGRHLWLETHAVPLRNEKDEIIALLGVTRDVTEQKRIEEERQNIQAQLFQAQKMESVGRLAGGVAHDFNNMLAGILGYTEMAMMECEKSEPILGYLKMIDAAARRSADLVRQLLAFARKQTVAPRVLDLNKTVENLLKMLRRLMGEDIDCEWIPNPALWPVKIDPSQIDQLLANLCVNARDSIAGVGKIIIETDNASFDRSYSDLHAGFVPGEYVMLGVSDNGCGMSKEVIDHLFEPFFTTKEAGKGTGLGLATVYGIVTQNGGFIDVYSEPGSGSTFKIYLPRFIGKEVEPAVEAVTEPSRGSGETVLLVEDEISLLDMMRDMLESLGYKVLTAGTPGEALLRFKAHSDEITLLITDVIMPEMNGWDLARSLREIAPGLKCLYSSAYTANVITCQGVLGKGMHFLQKPFSKKELASKVREALELE